MNSSYYNDSEVLEQRWRFSPLDYLTIVLAIVSSCTGTYFLVTYQGSISPLRDLTPIAEVGNYSQKPQRKIVGTLSWNGVRQKEVLFRGDQILTDEYSKIDIVFLDKTFLSVPPSSLIKLDFNNGEFDIELVKGYVDINLSKGNEKVTITKGKKKYKLNAKRGKVQVLSGQKDLKFKTIEGDVKIGGKIPIKQASSSKLYEIKEPLKKKVFNPLNEKVLSLNLKPQAKAPLKQAKPPQVVLSRYADLRKVQKLNIKSRNLEKELKLKLPKPGMYFLGVKEPGAVEFKVTPFQVLPYTAPKILKATQKKTINVYQGEKIPVAWTGRKDLPYEIQIKKDGETKSIRLTGTKAMVPILKSGTVAYRVRVASSSAPWSSWQNQNVAVKPGLQVDKTQTPDLFIKKKPQDTLSLSLNKKHQNPKGFLFEVSKDKEFKKIIQKKKVPKPALKWKKMTPGVYYWRATALEKSNKSTGPQRLIVKAPAISLSKNYKKNIISTQPQPEVNLKWSEQIKDSRYKVKVLDNATNRSIVEKEVKGNKVKIKLPKKGQYHWQVEPLDNKEFLLESPKIALNVNLPPPIESPKIMPKQIIDYRFINGVEAYEIELPKYKFAEFYYLEVFKDPQLKKLLFKKAFPNNKGYWVSNRSGKYYYRVRVTDKWGRKSKYSKVGVLIFPISPMVKE